jgi:hypothetical protein
MIRTKAESLGILVIASAPLVWVMGLLTYVLRARGHLGYWPTPYNPDPKVLPFHSHHSAIFVGVYLVLVALVALVGTRLFIPSYVRSSTWRKALVVCGFGWGLLLTMAFVRPINFVAWFLD